MWISENPTDARSLEEVREARSLRNHCGPSSDRGATMQLIKTQWQEAMDEVEKAQIQLNVSCVTIIRYTCKFIMKVLFIAII